MKLPVGTFLSAISDKKIYYFSSNKINSVDPHYYICIKRTDDDILIMSCCTSRFDTVKRFVETRSLPMETLVWISPDVANSDNPFSKDTYVNCNEYQTFTIEEFKNLYNSDSISYSGKISENHYQQIINGLHCSPLVDDESKDIIPKPE